MVFPVIMYECKSWTIKQAELQRIDAFELWCWRRLLRVPWTARRSNQSILKLCCCSVAWSCPTLCDPMDCSTPGFPVLHYLPEFAQTHIHRVSDLSNHLILCRPHLLLPSIFPSFRVFSNESVLPIRWPKYWGSSLSMSPSNEYSGLISLRIDWLDLLAVQGILKSLRMVTYHN